MRSGHIRFWMWIVFILSAAFSFSGLVAQDATQAFINYPQITESGDGLQLKLYFTVNDSSGQVVPTAQVRSARIVLADGSSYEAEVEQPNDPFYIVLVLDASGSMGGAQEDMQKAAAQLVQNAPSSAQFAVVRFNQQIDKLQDFTSQKNNIYNAISQVEPVNLSGTCLYDALGSAMSELGGRFTGRRAIILFTDGKDETVSGDACSSSTYDQVVATANQSSLRIPIHTIGMRGGQNPINEIELRNLASATGGLSAIGAQADMAALFGRVLDGLRSQWAVTATIYPPQGTVGVSLFTTLSNGTLLQPAGTTFVSPRKYSLPPTATPPVSPTPADTTIEIRSVSESVSEQMVTLEIIVQNGEPVQEYRIDLIDPDSLLKNSVPVPAPMPARVNLPVNNLVSGTYRIVIYALAEDGSQITQSAEKTFKHTQPTATPTATFTPTATGTATATATGTATATPTPTATATPLVVSLKITPLKPAADATDFDIQIEAANPDLIRQYKLELIGEDRLVIGVFKYPTPPYDLIWFPLSSMPEGGRYTLSVTALDDKEQKLAEASVEILYTPPPVPTITPSPTATLIPTEVPLLSAEGLAQNRGIIIPAIVVVIVALILVLVLLVRRSSAKPATGTGFLDELSGVYESAKDAPVMQPGSPVGDVNATNAIAAFDPNATNAVAMQLPRATLTVKRSGDSGQENKQITIAHVPFILGRLGQADANFDGDKNVSRKHAEITFNGKEFFISDLNSTLGTSVDGQSIGRMTPTNLPNGSTVVLGKTTILSFVTEVPPDFDAQSTNYGS